MSRQASQSQYRAETQDRAGRVGSIELLGGALEMRYGCDWGVSREVMNVLSLSNRRIVVC